jgi:hypothetical protein
MPTLQEVSLYIMISGGVGGAILGISASREIAPAAGSLILFSQGFGLLLSGVGDLKDREKTLGDLNIRANLDASGKILLGNGLMLSSIPLIMSSPLEDNKLLYGGVGLLLVAGSACLGIAQDKGNLMNW